MITSIAGDRVQTVDDVASVISSLSPGQRVSLAWIDQDGLSHVAGATLASRPST
jgi:S1-C subfamily serine protease